MKVEVEQSNVGAPTFPLLGQHQNGDIVLFQVSGAGTILKSSKPEHVGAYCDKLNMPDFVVFNGVLKLSN